MEIDVVFVDGNGGKEGVSLLEGKENGVGVGLEGRVLDEEAGVNEKLAVPNGSAHFDEMMRRWRNRTLEKGCGGLEIGGIVGRSLFCTRMNGF